MKLSWKRTLAGLLACLMMLSAAALPLNALAEWTDMDGVSASDLGIQVIVEYTDGEGNPVPVYATPVFEVPNTYWVQIPAEYMGSLTLRLEGPGHEFFFMPESGSPLAAMDAGMDLTGPSVMIQATEEDLTVSFLLYVSTMSAYPLIEQEETPEPVTEVPVTEVPVTEVPITEVPVTEVPVTEVPVTPEPITEVPVTEVPVTEVPVTEIPVTEVPVTEVPVTEVPVTEVPVTEVPVTEVPVTEVPVTEVPVTEVPVTEVPVTEAPVTEVPVTEVPVTAEPITEVPVTEAPVLTVEPLPDGAIVIQSADSELSETAGEDDPEEAESEPPVTEEPSPEPIETPIPVGEMINRYGAINSKQVAIRSEMSTVKKDKTVLSRANKGNYIYVLQERVNDNGESWSAVLFEGRVAYIKSEFLNILTQAESDAYMGETGEFIPAMSAEELAALEAPAETPVPETPAPEKEPEEETARGEEETGAESETASTLSLMNFGADELNENGEDQQENTGTEEETPEEETEPPVTEAPVTEPPVVETPIPMGELINRFARTNKKDVRVRTAPNTGSKKLVSDLKKGANVYSVREEIGEDGVSWTRVIVNGNTGYIQSQYLDVLTQAESDEVMAGWKGTPVPPVTLADLEEEAPAPETEVPETEAPVTEEPVTEEPVTEEPITEAPITEAPITEAPITEAPVTEAPVTEAPITEAPITEAPVTEAPVTEAPVTEAPITEAPVTEAPVTEAPVTEAPVTEAPVTEAPVTDAPVTEAPITVEPIVTAVPGTPEPPQITGYGITIGDGVYVRNWPASNSVIIDNLMANKVVFVDGQIYTDTVAWHQVRYESTTGYIRADMLRMMGTEEVRQYLDQTRATPQTPAQVTVEPLSGTSLSSYGYTTTTVNFRTAASTTSTRLRQLKRYALCLVDGTTEVNGETWYRVTYGGQTGYIKGSYFKHMNLTEFEAFLDSPEYYEGVANNKTGSSDSSTSTSTSSSSGSSGTTSTKITSAEDERVSVWTNPETGTVTSYAPFDPFATAQPVATEDPAEYLDSLVESARSGAATDAQLENLLKMHYQGSADADSLVAEGLKYIHEKLDGEETPSPEPSEEPTVTVEPEVPQESDGPGAAGIVIGAAALLGVAGVGYGIYTGRVRKRRAEAQRQAALKKRAAQQNRPQSGSSAGMAGGATRTGSTVNNTAASGRTGSTVNNSTASNRTGSTIDNSTVPGGTGSTAPNNAGSASRTSAQSPYARPASQSGTGTATTVTGAASASRKPYENTVENPYGRYSTKDGEDSGYTASFRPAESKPVAPDDDEPQAFTASFRPNGEGDTTPRRRRRSE